ncbi:hypothetical protein [Microvirga sp. M2]
MVRFVLPTLLSRLLAALFSRKGHKAATAAARPGGWRAAILEKR